MSGLSPPRPRRTPPESLPMPRAGPLSPAHPDPTGSQAAPLLGRGPAGRGFARPRAGQRASEGLGERGALDRPPAPRRHPPSLLGSLALVIDSRKQEKKYFAFLQKKLPLPNEKVISQAVGLDAITPRRHTAAQTCGTRSGQARVSTAARSTPRPPPPSARGSCQGDRRPEARDHGPSTPDRPHAAGEGQPSRQTLRRGPQGSEGVCWQSPHPYLLRRLPAALPTASGFRGEGVSPRKAQRAEQERERTRHLTEAGRRMLQLCVGGGSLGGELGSPEPPEET